MSSTEPSPTTAVSDAPDEKAPRTPASTDADFDGDGYPDLALGGGQLEVDDSRVVLVVYGPAAHAAPTRTQRWSGQDFDHHASSGFGDAIAFGDFDGDGYSDLVIGTPDVGVGPAKEYAGSVRILYGSSRGLTKARSQLWTQNSPGVPGRPESGDAFGVALAVANYGHGPQDDLAISGEEGPGEVRVLYGSSTGLTTDHIQVWNQTALGVTVRTHEEGGFGWTLAAGHFRPGEYDDLVVSVPGATVGSEVDAGAVHVINGSPTGLTAVGSSRWTQDSPGIPGRAEAGDAFGYSLAAGAFTGRPVDDLAIGIPYENGDKGAVTIIYNSGQGLTSTWSHTWSQASPGIADRPEPDDILGWSLAAGNFGRDQPGQRFADLAIRSDEVARPSADAGGGSITVIYGTPTGLTANASQTLTKQVTNESIGIDTSWRKQMTAIASARPGLDDLVVGCDEWVRIITTTANGLDTSKRPTSWTPAVLGHPEVWYGIADKVAG